MDGIDWMTVAEVVPITAAHRAARPSRRRSDAADAVVALALLGAMLGFAPFNRPVAQLFLGDVGSLPIGLLLAWLLLQLAAQRPSRGGAAAPALLSRRRDAHAAARACRAARTVLAGASHAFLSTRDRRRLQRARDRRARVRGQSRARRARAADGRCDPAPARRSLRLAAAPFWSAGCSQASRAERRP